MSLEPTSKIVRYLHTTSASKILLLSKLYETIETNNGFGFFSSKFMESWNLKYLKSTLLLSECFSNQPKYAFTTPYKKNHKVCALAL